MDERYGAIDVLGKGLVIFSSYASITFSMLHRLDDFFCMHRCSHAGIVNVVTDAIKTFRRPVHMVIGGLHLGGPELASRIKPTVDFLAKQLQPSPDYVLPMHCTGFNAKIALKMALGEGCVPTGVGNVVAVKGDADADKKLVAPILA